MSLPRKWTWPLKRNPRTRSFMRFRQRSTVLLPQPEGPMNAVICALLDGDLRVAHGLESAVIQLLDVAVDDGVAVGLSAAALQPAAGVIVVDHGRWLLLAERCAARGFGR